tara:strand:+ start:202 stop:537 length:336 start_codon:yes stop_codon:yes gene_type:complete
MARKMPHGQRYRYPLDDGTTWTVPEARAKMLELWKEPASESLMQQRMAHSTNPEYVFLKKGSHWEGGHEYSRKNQERKKAKLLNITKPKPKLTAQELALKKAYIAAGIAWT